MGASLDEISIFRSQQLDIVTVPIKLRAIVKGCSTGWRDRFGYHDNSWWESFGAGHTKSFVQAWLLLVCTLMVLALIVGPIRLFLGPADTFEARLFPVVFGAAQALVNVWVISDALFYLLKGRADRPFFSLRYMNLGMLLVVVIVVLTAQASTEAASRY